MHELLAPSASRRMVRNPDGAAMLCASWRRGLPAMRLAVLRQGCLFVALLLPALAAPADAPAEKSTSVWVDPATAAAEIMPLAAKSLLLDITRSGGHYVAVGARGDVLLSDDGRAWRQVEVPTRATLTAVTAVDAQVWAVGHDGMILHSADGGEHWQIQRKDPWQAADAGGDPTKGAPLLDVLFVDATHGFAIGAYSLALQTADGGSTWQPMTVAANAKDDDRIDDAGSKRGGNDKETFTAEELKVGQEATPHLNAITRTGSGALLIVAERGSAFRSRDNGATWKRLQLPYDGSMFGVLGYAGDHVLAFGLRGHAFESADLGDHWTLVETGTQLSLMGGAATADGGAVIAGANGIVLMRGKGGEPLRGFVEQSAGIIAKVLPLEKGSALLLAGENGVSSFELK
jgi:photosystem II stability/assembly factor-like uncharacterized protein